MNRLVSDDRGWPSHGTALRDWRQSIRSGSRADRMLRTVAVSIPPYIADLDFSPPADVSGITERALIETAATDGGLRIQSRALARFMIRSESVASSKIERVNASATDFARAIAGSRANTSATSMVAASTALHRLVEQVGDSRQITLDDVLSAHRTLMRDDAYEAAYAGRWRDVQNWIGGSDHSPRDALYVPPPPELVEPLMRDLLTWANRDDLPVFVQLAIAHAQFESIHPFTDGNGRIGRALVSALLRRRGVTRAGVMPLASGLLAVRDQYFAALTTYRAGDPSPIVALIARAASAAAVESRSSMQALMDLPGEWRGILDTPRGSVADRLLEALLDEPVLSGEQAAGTVDATPAATYAALDRLVDAGILAEVTGRKRDRVWAAGEVLGELDELDRRIQNRMLHDD